MREIGDTVAVGAPLIRLKVEGVAEGGIPEAKAQEALKGANKSPMRRRGRNGSAALGEQAWGARTCEDRR